MLKVTNLAQFQAGIDKFSEKVNDTPVQIAKKIMLEINKQVILGSPVITGLYVGSWQISSGVNPSNMTVYITGQEANEGHAKSSQISKNETKIMKFDGGTLWLSNNAEYALYLEYGTENMRAQYVLTKAIQTVLARINELAK